jgi:hypothetical protein
MDGSDKDRTDEGDAMSDELVLREPEEIRQDCAAKFRPEMSDDLFCAILGYLLGEDWGEPRIESIIVSDECVLARTVGQVTHSSLLGARECLIRQLICLAKAVGLDGDEQGYLLAAIAKIKRV